jgi:hypothetical protein
MKSSDSKQDNTVPQKELKMVYKLNDPSEMGHNQTDLETFSEKN